MLYLYVIAPIFLGALSMILKKLDVRPFFILFQIGFFIVSVMNYFDVRTSGAITQNMSHWQDGIAIRLRLDLISSVMVVSTVGLFLVFLIFSYHKDYFENKFIFLMMVLQGLINGLFMSVDIFNIFIFLEVSTVVVAILIMYTKEKQAIYDGMIYFFVNVIGASFLLFGIGMLYQTFGVLDLDVLAGGMNLIQNPQAMFLPFAFLMTTLSLKNAAVPLFSWLPKAHGTPSAPPVVSATLSGLYINTGVYLFIRFSNVFDAVINVDGFFLTVGIITVFFGGIMAISQKDIKLLLAYSTISQVGMIMIGLTIGGEQAIYGSLYHIFAHAIFKSVLFLAAGQIYDHYGTRDLTQIKGIFKEMPLTGISVLVAILGITGAPLFNGSISKYLLSYGHPSLSYEVLMNLVSLFTLFYFMRLLASLVGPVPDYVKDNVNVDKLSEITVAVLALGVLLTGVFAEPILNSMFAQPIEVFGASYIQKAVVYVISFAIAFLAYKFIFVKSKLLTYVADFEISFNGIITSMVGFFFVLLIYLSMVY